MIQRYSHNWELSGFGYDDSGAFILYEDHAKIVKNLTDEIMHWNEKYYEMEERLRVNQFDHE